MSLLSNFLAEAFLEQAAAGIVVLMPGGFKPPHGGHLDLAKRYASHPKVQEVQILIGPKERQGITRAQSIAAWKALLAGVSNIKVLAVEQDNPLLAAYKYIETAAPGKYALAASSKGDDYDKVKKFAAGHAPGAKYAKPGVVVVNLPLDVQPLNYATRQDQLAGQPISATTVRADLAAGDLKKFATNYPGTSPSTIKQVYQILKPSSTKAELTEGGAAGHLVHPYEDIDLTFQDVETMITLVLSGEIKSVQEKLDGQNLMVSYKGGHVVAARNKGHLKNFGENSLSIKQVEDTFAGRGPIQAAFTEAMRDLEAAISRLTVSQRSMFFQNGKRFLNLEVLYPATANVVPYGTTQLRLHNIRTYDQEGNVTDEDQQAAKQLDGALRQVQADNQKTFQIKVTNPVTIAKSADYDNQKAELLSIVDKIRTDAGLQKTDKVKSYYVKWWVNFTTEQAKQLKYKISQPVRDLLVARWGFDQKQPNIKDIRSQVDSEAFRAWIDQFDKSGVQVERKNVARPLEMLFLKLGVYALRNIQGLVALNPNQSISTISADLRAAIARIKTVAASPDSGDGTEALAFLKRELARLKDIGGFKAIVPTEGLVFKYNDKLYKLTGSFAPINQILGYLRF